MKRFDVRTFQNVAEWTAAAANLFVELSERAIQEDGVFAVALSGGSTPKSLYELLATPDYRERIRWSNVKIFWGDERFVPPDHSDSNYRMAREALLSKVPIPSNNIFPVPTTNTTPKDSAMVYERTIRQQTGSFHLILLGLGQDGHTASLFPYSDSLKERERLVVENYVAKLNSHRITLTIPAINQAATVVFLVSGDSKTEVFKQILEGPYDPERLPAQQIHPVSGQLIFMVTM